jgi:phage shock protein PspC (stress-responsive transcriptional regulator)
MSEHETDQPGQPQTPPPPPPEAPPAPRRFLRSRDDRVVGGVAGGLGRYFDVDPVFFRVGLVALAFLGGIGLVVYLAALLFVPSEQADGGEPPPRGRGVTIAGSAVLVVLGIALLADASIGDLTFSPLGFLVLLGAAVWWLVRGRSRAGEGRARHVLTRIALAIVILVASFALFVGAAWTAGLAGGAATAGLVIAVGGLLVLAAFRGGARWLIVPALAIAAGVGLVAAADVDLDGGYGERVYVPTSVADVRESYELGAGRLEVDLRGVEFPAGERHLELDVGVGEAVLVVPRDLCVVADADVGAGYLRMLRWDTGGFNVGWDHGGAAQDGALLVVDAHVGMGALEVVHDPHDVDWQDERWERGGHWNDVHEQEDASLGRSAACAV